MAKVKNERKFDRELIEAQENLLIDIQFLIQELMDKKAISRTELAEKAHLSKPRISQLMSAIANPTVKNIAGIFYALGEELLVSSRPKASPKKPTEGAPLSDSEWKWETSDLASTSDMLDEAKQARMIKVVKESIASNDNYKKQVVMWDKDSDVLNLEAA